MKKAPPPSVRERGWDSSFSIQFRLNPLFLLESWRNMGADKPKLEKKDSESKMSFFPLLVGTAVLAVAVALFSKMTFDENGNLPKLNPRDEAKLQKRLKEIDDSEQYALVATVNGWYPCLHSGRATCYLKIGEVWKYGVTSKGKFGRYTAAFLIKNRVSYIVQFKGNISECLKQEQIRLFNYPNLPENLARPPTERLPRPPYNAIMR